jgi:phosphoserine phosphatase
MAVLSGGFQPLAEWLAGELGLDYAVANHVSPRFQLPKYHNLPLLNHHIA